MSWEATAIVKGVTHTAQGQKLNTTDKLVLVILSDSVNPDYGYAWPSIATLAKLCLSSERTIQYVLRKLEKGKLIRSERSEGRKTKYYILPKQDTLNFTPANPAPVQPEVQKNTLSCTQALKSRNEDSPLPPASGGEESSFEWCREKIAVQMGRRKRLPSLGWAAGARADAVADFLTRRGFPARVLR